MSDNKENKVETINKKTPISKTKEWECENLKNKLIDCINIEPILNCMDVFMKYNDCMGNDIYT